MENVKLMNMCKIINTDTKKVLVQERVKSWQEVAFPRKNRGWRNQS